LKLETLSIWFSPPTQQQSIFYEEKCNISLENAICIQKKHLKLTIQGKKAYNNAYIEGSKNSKKKTSFSTQKTVKESHP
jgi:hypothetical protein